MVAAPASANLENGRLALVRDLVGSLDAERISYCHWKSNENLAATMAGKADLDVLFDPSKREETHALLKRLGFVECLAAPHRRYPGIEDFIGIDAVTGRVVHVHAHFLLVLGETGLKSYELDLMERLLSGREWDEEHGIYRSDAKIELLLLLLRESMKLDGKRKRQLSRGAAGGAGREFAWLKERVPEDALCEEARALLGADSEAVVAELYRDGLTLNGLKDLQAIVARRFAQSRRYSAAGAWFEARRRTFSVWLARRARKLGIGGVAWRRRVKGRGLIVAFLGPDGAGKSTLTNSVADELGRKLDVERVYMGSGAGGPPSALRRVLQILRFRKLGGPFRVLWELSLAREKRNALRRITAWRDQGIVVVSDRYPQAEIDGHNDGPLLARFRESKSGFLRSLASWERRCYETARELPPDLVCRMRIDVAEIARRRPGTDVEWVRTKQQGIERLTFPAQTRVAELNAGQPPEAVLRDAMAAIGAVLTSSQDRVSSR